jgi:hypothetical protein
MQEGTTLRVMAADRPYGEFYDLHSISPEYFGYHHWALDTCHESTEGAFMFQSKLMCYAYNFNCLLSLLRGDGRIK